VFIRREIEALRRLGVVVETASLRTPSEAELLTEADRLERASTYYIQPVRPLALLREHLLIGLGSPLRYLQTLHKALLHRRAGARGLLWALFHFAEAIQLAAELGRRGVEHIHSHFANAGGTVGLLASEVLGVGWSVTLHGLSDFGDPEGQRLAEKIGEARFVACVSEHGRAQALRFGGPAAAGHTHVVRCGLPANAFRDRARGDEAGEGTDPLRIICVGRLAPEKGHLGLLEALASARSDGLEARLTLVGEGPERPEIEARIAALGIGEHVDLPGALAGPALRDRLADSDLFVLSSFMEGLPVTLMEALAVGTPAVVPGLSGIPELVRQDEEGWLYTAGRFDSLADALLRAGKERGVLAAMGERGRERVRQLHDIDEQAATLRGLLAAAAGRG
jgi:glycosyltransferase involved in cell wall biosynthesis